MYPDTNSEIIEIMEIQYRRQLHQSIWRNSHVNNIKQEVLGDIVESSFRVFMKYGIKLKSRVFNKINIVTSYN